jgi:hypothetical protein
MKVILFLLISFLSVTATLSGLLLISQPDGSLLNLPLSLLDGTYFSSYLVPGILLVIFVGGVNLLAVFYNLKKDRTRYDWAMAGGFVVSGWVAIQLLLIHTVHWLHILYFGIGVIVFLLAYQLKGKWIV